MSHSTNPLAGPPKKSEGNGRLIIAILFIVGLIWVLISLDENKDEPSTRPRPTSTPAKPNLDYTLLDGEDYGSAGNMGHSYRMIVPADAGITDVYAAARYEALRHNPGQASVTIFVYNGRDPREDGNWIADRFYEWVRETDTFKQCNGPC